MSQSSDPATDAQSRAERFEAAVEIPMIVLSLLIVPVALMPVVEDLTATSLRTLEVLGVVIWALFAVQYIVLLYLSTDRWHTVKTHKLDLVLVALPFLRPLRLFRIVRLAQAGVGFGKLASAFRKIAFRPGFLATVATVAGLILIGGALVAVAESGQPGSTIESVGDGLWWALVTCTTVGYGDEFPVTSTGRFIAILLMLGGISALSAVTANVAAYFVESDSEPADATTDRRLDVIESRLGEISRQLARLQPGD